MIRVGGLALLLAGCSFNSSGFGGGSTTAESGETPPSDSSGGASASASASGTTLIADGTTSTSGVSTGEGSTSSVGSDSSSSSSSSEAESTGSPPPRLCEPRGTLRACYDFSGVGGGTLVDLSDNGNDGAVSGIDVVPGPFGEAAQFDGDGQIEVPDSPSLDVTGALTFEVWLNVDTLPGSGDRMGVLDNGGQYSLFIYDTDEYRCAAGGVLLHAGPVVLGEWSHVACVLDPSTEMLTMVVNGVPVLSDGPTGSINTGANDGLTFGHDSPVDGGVADRLDGAIGGVRIWNAARSDSELCEAAGELCRS